MAYPRYFNYSSILNHVKGAAASFLASLLFIGAISFPLLSLAEAETSEPSRIQDNISAHEQSDKSLTNRTDEKIADKTPALNPHSQEDLQWRGLKQTEVWVEEKINPTAQSIEDFFKPLIKWTEHKLHSLNELGAKSQFVPPLSPPKKTTEPHQLITPPLEHSATVLTHEEAIKKALSHFQGTPLGSEFLAANEPPCYRIKILLKAGQVQVIHIDALSGEFINLPTEK